MAVPTIFIVFSFFYTALSEAVSSIIMTVILSKATAASATQMTPCHWQNGASDNVTFSFFCLYLSLLWNVGKTWAIKLSKDASNRRNKSQKDALNSKLVWPNQSRNCPDFVTICLKAKDLANKIYNYTKQDVDRLLNLWTDWLKSTLKQFMLKRFYIVTLNTTMAISGAVPSII